MQTITTTEAVSLAINDDIINKATRAEMPALNARMRPVRMTLPALTAHVSAGKAFCIASLTPRADGFASRNQTSWNGSQLIAIDIDNSVTEGDTKRRRSDAEGYVSLTDLLRDEYIGRYAWLIYTSPSHTDDWHRIRVVFRTPEVFADIKHHKTAIDAFVARFNADAGASSAVNIFYGNTQATVHQIGRTLTVEAMRETIDRYKAVQTEERRAKLYIDGTPDVEATKAMLRTIPARIDYLDWVRIVSGVASVFDPATAETLINEWSEGERGEVAYKIKHRMSNVGFGTVVYIARRYGWNPPAGFFSDDKPRKGSEAAADAEQYMTAFYRTRYNTVKARVEYSSIDDAATEWTECTDYHMHSLLREMRAEGIKIAKDRLYELITSNYSAPHDPIRGYFDTLPDWDGVDHITALGMTLGAADDDTRAYHALVLRQWMASAVACAVDNKANHIVPILQGVQGAYKTTWITSLCPDALRDYMHIGTVTGDKDSLIALCETFLFVDDELETINRKEIGIFKRIVTQSEIKVRAPYGRMTETRKRRASFIGSVNRTTFLNDETGSRRFPVLAVEGLIDMAARRAIPTAQLWAQAQHIYRSGEVHWFDAGDVKVIERNNAAHQHRSDADELLARWYVPCERATPHAVELSTTDVAVQLAGKVAAANPDVRIQMSDRFVQSVGKALTAQGYTRAQRKIGGQPRYLWSLREVTASDAVSDEAQDELF